jgi:hypothetical protein
LHCSKGGV